MTSMEEIFEIARSGNGYLAIEKSSLYVRKLKKTQNLNDAMAFLMDLASVLAETHQYDSATNCALRSIRMFPAGAPTIKVFLLNKFKDFIKNATPEYNNPDFYSYASTFIDLIPDTDNEIRFKLLEVASQSNNFAQTECLLIQLIYIHIKKFSFHGKKISSLLKRLAEVLWIWAFTIDIPPSPDRRQQRLYNAQILFLHSIFALIPAGEIRYTEEYIGYIKETQFSSILDDFYESPPFHFAKFYIRAITNHSQPTAKFLEEKYKPLIENDQEFQKLFDRVKGKAFPYDFDPDSDFSSLMQSVMDTFGFFG